MAANDNRNEALQRLVQEARLLAKTERAAWLAERCGGDMTLVEHALEQTELPSAAPGPLQPTERIGRYELLDRIGRGGMGVVYRARQIDLDRVVALKTILNEAYASADDIARFQIEARAAGSLDHPGIVSVHEIGEHAGRPYYTMDYVPGQTLSAIVTEAKLSPSDAASVTLRVAEAVAYAHENGVIHRDLKPSNILMDANGAPRVADFGLAKRIHDNQELTETGQALGTPNYMSPEQAMGKRSDVGPRSDVYGLGAILYALLTGVPPIQSSNREAVLRRVIEELPAPPRSLNATVDRDLDAICLKCLEKQIDDRYSSVDELIGDLKRYLGGSSVTARPNSYGRILKHWSRRPERIPQSAALILVVAAFYGLSVVCGLGLISLGLVPISDPVETGLIITLDFFGLAICLPVGLGMLRRRLWSIWLGILSGSGMTIIVGSLLATGFEAGGVLADPFRRASIYMIFGFIGILMIAASFVALQSHAACRGGHNDGDLDQPLATTSPNAAEQ